MSWRANLIGVGVLNLVNGGIALVLTALSLNFLNIFTSLAMLEAAGLFLIGGGIDLTSTISSRKARESIYRSKKPLSVEDSKKSQRKAAKYVFLGLILFVESIGLWLIP